MKRPSSRSKLFAAVPAVPRALVVEPPPGGDWKAEVRLGFDRMVRGAAEFLNCALVDGERTIEVDFLQDGKRRRCAVATRFDKIPTHNTAELHIIGVRAGKLAR